MRRVMLAVAAAVALLTQPASAASQAQDPRDRQGEPILPGTQPDRATMPDKADRQAAPERESQEEAIRKDLEEWRERVHAWRREHEARGGAEGAARMDQALLRAEQSWRRLAQSDRTAWEREMKLFEEAREELSRAWKEANS